jgi:uncharacterized delta-60 repeat protein
VFLHSLVRYGPIAALALIGAPVAPGDLDPAFAIGGKVSTDFERRFDEGRGMAIQPDGRIVAGEMIRTVNPQDPPQTGDRNFAVVRYLANGALDTSFGVGGRVFTDFGQDFELAFDMALQPDGKIVAAGESGTGTAGGNFDFAVARYNTDGSLDTSFNGDGRATIDFGGDDDAARSVTLQPDGKVVVAGYSGNESDEDSYDFAVARYNTDGSLDTSFSGDGTVKTDFAGSADSAFAVAAQPNGRILVAGSATGPDPEGDFAVVRYRTDGSLDGSFGSSGKVFTDFGGGHDEIDALALRPDGTFIAAGGSGVSEDPAPGGAFALARYLSNGKLDTSFGSGGTVETEFTGGLDQAFGLALQTDGKIIAAGVADQFLDPIGRGDFALARYRVNGSLDSSFGTYGKVTTDFEGAFDNARDVAVQRDGKIVVAGEATHPNTTSRDIAVVRYIAR